MNQIQYVIAGLVPATHAVEQGQAVFASASSSAPSIRAAWRSNPGRKSSDQPRRALASSVKEHTP